MKNKNQGSLYIIAAPIGNAKDITLRALDKLRTLDLIACEDTRITAKLCNLHKITCKGRLTSYHEHNAKKMIPTIIKKLKLGNNIGLISDAGTPLISDPGYKLVNAALSENLIVKTVPGPSAITAALSISGISSDQFFFTGFLPKKKSHRSEKLLKLKELPSSIIIFESAYRISTLMKEIYSHLGNRKASILKELTKIYEENINGSVLDIIKKIKKINLKGEYVIIIEKPDMKVNTYSEEEIIKLLKKNIKKLGIAEASKEIAKKTMTKRDYIYKIALNMKQ